MAQPNPPSTVIFDEPELGLHPVAISVLAELIQSASKSTQVIVATKRMENLSDWFKKTSTGIAIAKAIGLNTFREGCPLFNDWLTTVEILLDQSMSQD